jgi:hypothetical protein
MSSTIGVADMTAGANDRLQGTLLANAALQGLSDATLTDPTLSYGTQPAVVNALLAIYHELVSEREVAEAAIPSQRQSPDTPLDAVRALAAAIDGQTERLERLHLVAEDILAEMKAARHARKFPPGDVDELGPQFPDIDESVALEEGSGE